MISGYGIYIFYLKNDSQRTPENVLKAYYDALDFKQYEKAYELVDPAKKIKIAQFMLELSVSDGILGSYAKLDSIGVQITHQNDSSARAVVYLEWVTPLEKVSKVVIQNLVAKKDKWYIKLNKLDFDLPPDQLYTSNRTSYFNHGRRKITTEQTYHEDVLKRPVLEILSAKLVKNNNHYALIGEIQNIDNVPADIVLKGFLYNENNKELATYNSKHTVKHKLMPKEVSSFKISFEGIAWSQTKDTIPETFNPDEFTPVEFSEQPVKFNLQAIGSVTGSDLYKNNSLNELKVDKNKLSGFLFNTGIEEITIPQILLTHYNKQRKLIWVEHIFLEEGIRQERKRYFEYRLESTKNLKVINESMENCFVNGLPNKSISNKVVPNRIPNHSQNQLQIVNNDQSKFLKVELNNFIGNPK